jgi:hypothetical protein
MSHPFEHARYLMNHMLIIRYLTAQCLDSFQCLEHEHNRRSFFLAFFFLSCLLSYFLRRHVIVPNVFETNEFEFEQLAKLFSIFANDRLYQLYVRNELSNVF